MTRSILITLGLASLGVAQASHAQMRPANAAEIIGATEACMAAVAPSGVDQTKLSEQGWKPATASKDGKAVALPMPIYGKGSVMIMLSPGKSPGCIVTARVRKVVDAESIRDQIAKRVKIAPFAEMNGGPIWLLPTGNVLQFATTGSREKPGVRIAVVRSSGDKN